MYDVIIIGGGATGTSLLRDLSLRGNSTLLIERKRLGIGATGNCHGNLVGGMRYVVTDPQVAIECAEENKIITRIAPSIVGEIRDYFVGYNNEYTDKAIFAAKRLGIRVKEMDSNTIHKELECLRPEIDVIVETEDKNINPERLCFLNCESAKKASGGVIEQCVTEDVRVGGKIDVMTSKGTFASEILINATGAWANEITQKVGVTIPLRFNRGTILLQKTLSPRGIQYLRYPSDGDAYKVHGDTAYLGTTSVDISDPYTVAEPWEEDYLKGKLGEIIPGVKEQPKVGFLAGVRPLPSPSMIPSTDSRLISRGMMTYENPEGLITVIGGKLTTARLMAERISDYVCDKLGNNVRCKTAKEPLVI